MVVKGILLIVGVVDFLSGAALLLAPRWFYDNIGTIPPYSRHFLGDTGAFMLPVGAALLVAARDPRHSTRLVLVGATASVLHFLNHLAGSVTASESWLLTLAVAVPAVAMLGVTVGLLSAGTGRHRSAPAP